MTTKFVEEIKENIIVADGAMGTMLYSRGMFINRCYDELNLTDAETITSIHDEYVQAGATLIETNTFGANPVKLQDHGLAERTEEINRRGAELAREAVGNREAWVGGSIGPLGKPLSPIGKISVKEAIEFYRVQVRGLVAGGVDLLVVETISDLQEMGAAIQAVHKECDLPIVAMATFPAEGRTLMGFTPVEVMTSLTRMGVDVVGANCSEGPHDMLGTIERLRLANQDKPIAAMPNAGNPRYHDDRVLYLSSPEYMAEYARRFIEAGATLVGGCCGTTPDHVRAIAAMVKMLKPSRPVTISATPLEKAKMVDPVPLQKRSPLGAKLARQSVLGRKFVVSVEMNPARGQDDKRVLAAA